MISPRCPRRWCARRLCFEAERCVVAFAIIPTALVDEVGELLLEAGPTKVLS